MEKQITTDYSEIVEIKPTWTATVRTIRDLMRLVTEENIESVESALSMLLQVSSLMDYDEVTDIPIEQYVHTPDGGLITLDLTYDDIDCDYVPRKSIV